MSEAARNAVTRAAPHALPPTPAAALPLDTPPPGGFLDTAISTVAHYVPSFPQAATDASHWTTERMAPLLVTAAVSAWVLYRLPEWQAVIAYRTRKGLRDARTGLRDWYFDFLDRSEWNHYARQSKDATTQKVERLRRRADRQRQLAEILLHQSQRARLWRATLVNRAHYRMAKHGALNAEANRIEELVAEIRQAGKGTV